MKTIWVTSLSKNQARVQAVTEVLKRYGLNVKGHFWVDAPDKMAWRVALDELKQAKAHLWLVLADAQSMSVPSVQYGLSLFSASLEQECGAAVAQMCLWPGELPERDSADLLCHRAIQLSEGMVAWPAKVVAKANVPSKPSGKDYRLRVIGEERLGQWFEVGPQEGHWEGVLFGVCGGDAQIDFHAVGTAGALPEKTVLEYAQEGIELKLANARVYRAWAVRNRLTDKDSYFVRVKGQPASVLFMPYTDADDAAATVLQLAAID